MLLAEEIGNKRVILQCRDDLAPQGGDILKEIRRTFTPQSERLTHGFTIQWGWSVLCLRDRTPDLILCEPSFRGNPFVEWSDDVTTTLAVLSMQVAFLRSIDFPGSDCVTARFDDKIVLAKGCLSNQRIYLERINVSRGRPGLVDDSGWYIGPVPALENTPEYQSMRIYELLRLRPAAVQVLELPPGFLVIFDGNKVAGIQGPQGRSHAPWRLDS
jgi:hypothetical protein